MTRVDVRRQMIGCRLRLIRARQKAGMSQARAARLAGIHRPSLSLIEDGKQRLTVDLLLTLAELYGFDPAVILTGSGQGSDKLGPGAV